MIQIAPELEAQAKERARVEGISVEAYLERLIREDGDWEEFREASLSEADPEFAGIKEAVDTGLTQADRGETTPVEEVFAALRSKHGLPD